ncbi:NupC/NupG family nucleoside CNT transporter [Salibacter halophilus]|uniref:NupC/NupG family nucleoside CNT transporter n=1 Tax=Salibacter halophilus TaxID=1803916 RepID=A0A6N6M610_9FLAO|nr:nucleoside transporter C-terminal domain-containing protein [Salibacter halophilus]KAB1063803.1 NupC/NupG family nucleoside CNT transporter [Salibacter halophilus]
MISSITFVSVLKGLIGILFLLFIAYLLSEKRKNINWSLVIKGLIIQFIFAIGVLKIPAVADVFEFFSTAFVKVISFTYFGTEFLFRNFETGEIDPALMNFAFNVLPTIVFFSALTSLLYYLGILQKIVYGFAWVMKRAMKLSGAESLAAAGNMFMGQTEAPLLVKPYLLKMTKSEMMALMTGGMATIAGGVLASYIGFLGGSDPAEKILFAKHLLAASIMSAPAGLVAAKMLVPETEPIEDNVSMQKQNMGANVLEAISNGTTDGIKLAVNVAGMLLVFTAFIYFGNYILEQIGELGGFNAWIAENTNYDNFSFQFVIGYLFAPIAYVLGVPWDDVVLVGQLLGEKTILNEFYAYVTLGKMKAAELFTHEKSVVMATYILCGFSNFASIGIQIGGIGSLVPNRKGLLSNLGIKALVGGTLACLFTASIVGMLI